MDASAHLPSAADLSDSAPKTEEVAAAGVVLFGRDHEALQVQLAAVAAQQAALTEEETRLGQRALALTKQETQLAKHLEERQRRLDEEVEQLRLEREQFHQERDNAREEIATEKASLAELRATLEQQAKTSAAERVRLANLHRDLVKRYQRETQRGEQAVAKREAEARGALQHVERERTNLKNFQERLNGQFELTRIRLHEKESDLVAARRKWEQERIRERKELDTLNVALEQRSAELRIAEDTLASNRRRFEQEQSGASKELQTLQTRIRQERVQLDQLQRETRKIMHRGDLSQQIAPMSPSLLTQAVNDPEIPSRLRMLAENIEDQRRHLAKQWEQLLQVQEDWQTDRAATLSELQNTTEALTTREEALTQQQERLQTLQDDLDQRSRRLENQRAALEGRHTRLTLQETQAAARTEEMLDSLEVREQALQERRSLLEEVQIRRTRRRQDELAALKLIRTRASEAHRHYAGLWQECERLRETLSARERKLDVRELVVQRLRLEVINDAGDSARTEATLDKLEKRELARSHSEAATLTSERRRLLEERKRLDDDLQKVQRLEGEVLARLEWLGRRMDGWEQQRHAIEDEDIQRQHELQRAKTQQELDRQQLRQLHDELERLAATLIEDEEPILRAA
jgi:hypothetical protein